MTKTDDIVDNKIELKIGADVVSVVKNISKTDLKAAPENEKEDKKEEKRIEPVAPVAPKDPPIVVESKSTQEDKVQKPRNDIDKKEIVDDSNVDGKSEVPLERGKKELGKIETKDPADTEAKKEELLKALEDQKEESAKILKEQKEVLQEMKEHVKQDKQAEEIAALVDSVKQ